MRLTVYCVKYELVALVNLRLFINSLLADY